MNLESRMYFYAIMFVQSLMASGTHIVAKIVVRDVDPVTLTFLRSFIAAVALVIIILIRRQKIVFERKDWGKLIFLSVLAISLNQFFFLSGIRYSTASNAALFYGTTPALVLVISVLRGMETLSWKKSSGVVLAFVGILLIVFEHGLDFGSDHTFGNVLLVLAVISWALYTVLGRPLILRYGAFATSAATMILGMVIFLPFGILNTLRFPIANLTLPDWGGLLYLALFTSIFAYFLWYYALGKVEASKVAIFANLQPVMTTIFAVVILGQGISHQFMIGGAIALAGVVLTQRG